jgi:hypothetical protein
LLGHTGTQLRERLLAIGVMSLAVSTPVDCNQIDPIP